TVAAPHTAPSTSHPASRCVADSRRRPVTPVPARQTPRNTNARMPPFYRHERSLYLPVVGGVPPAGTRAGRRGAGTGRAAGPSPFGGRSTSRESPTVRPGAFPEHADAAPTLLPSADGTRRVPQVFGARARSGRHARARGVSASDVPEGDRLVRPLASCLPRSCR